MPCATVLGTLGSPRSGLLPDLFQTGKFVLQLGRAQDLRVIIILCTAEVFCTVAQFIILVILYLRGLLSPIAGHDLGKGAQLEFNTKQSKTSQTRKTQE